jgi:phosphoenolpyruvate synthase/pyruvate phosphate dikinase
MKKFFNELCFKKITAVFVMICFLITSVFGSSVFASIGTSIPNIENIKFDNSIIPTSLGKITSAKYFDSEDIIINIQDLHCHAETQRKIASIIEYIDNTYNLNNVYLEGAFKTVDTSWLSVFNKDITGSKVLEGLIDSGKICGTEYYSVVNNKKNFVLGIEDEDLYKENIKLLGEILSLQPEVNAICSQLEKEINKVKRDYSSRQARKLQRLIKLFKQKEIDAKYFYGQLKFLADTVNLSTDKYPNITIYISLLEKGRYFNDKKVVYEFTKFVSEIKNMLPYQQYSELLKKSNNFSNLEDISLELITLNKQHNITQKLKLTNFANFLSYLEFNQNINPIKLVQEEEKFINELYVKLGRTKYEKEVSFLAEFIPTIKQYFTADISADEYYKFEKKYETFKTVWPSYFSEDILKNLEPYQILLARYHKNNITRDRIFSDYLISGKNTNSNVYINDTNLAIKQIKTNLSNKNLKLVVTGGFHTRGLEKSLEQQRISYVIITPKITQPIEQAKQIYIDNVMYYSNILKNTIKPVTLAQEPLNVSFPEMMNIIFTKVQEKTIFENYSKEQLRDIVKDFIQKDIIDQQGSFYGKVRIKEWDIISKDLTGKIEFFVEYADEANNGMVSKIEYLFVDGQIVPYAVIDNDRTKQMAERINANKYALPSIELEPTKSARKKVAKYILEPLQKVAGDAVDLMPFEQVHMTIGYDSTPMTQQEIGKKIKGLKKFLKKDKDDSVILKRQETKFLLKEKVSDIEIFSVIDTLIEKFFNYRTSMAGTLKLMPDGVIIYEITDEDLIEKMLELRSTLQKDSKYKTPKIVHMTIGRITDEKLLDGSGQSKQELAELLKKINETIYEINKKNALSKIKTSFTLKSGYVSSTGDKDYVVARGFPKKESLVIVKNLIRKSKTKSEFFYEVVVAPIIEETLFRFVPFFITGLFVSSPASIIPAIVTAIVGVLGFSFAHPLFDKINNYFYKQIEKGKIKNTFIAELFNQKIPVRNVRDFLFPSLIFTAIYVAISIAFPQTTFVAFAATTVVHSLLNIFANNKLTIVQTSQNKKELNLELGMIIETLKNIAKNNESLGYEKARNDFIDDFENIGTDEKIITQKVIELFDFVKQNCEKEHCFALTLLLEPILNISAYLKDEQDKSVFDSVFRYLLLKAEDKKNSSSRYFDILMDSAKYFYKNGQIEYVHKIFDSLYKNKIHVNSQTDYGRFALPIPSPFSSDFNSVEEWETEIRKIMMEEKITSHWYVQILEVFLASSVENLDEYAKAIIRALYKSGKETKPPFIKNVDNYVWAKSFYEACGDKSGIFAIEQSEPLLDEENVKLFSDNTDILKTNNLYLSDIISRLEFVKQYNPLWNSFEKERYEQIIKELRGALSLPKQAQIEIVTTQMNNLVELFAANGSFRQRQIVKTLIPIMFFIKSNTTSQSLLNDIFQEIDPSYANYEEMKLDIISFVYDINKQEAFSLIGKMYNSYSIMVKYFSANWKTWRPASLQEAYDKIPDNLKDKIKTSEDLELFYYTIGMDFDIPEGNSTLYDRREYVPEYQLLFDKLPAFVFKKERHITKKYFRTLKEKMLSQNTTTSKKNEEYSKYFDALEMVLENNMFALSGINKANKDAIEDSFFFTEEMINNLAVLNDTLADRARHSLEGIKKNFYESRTKVSDLVKLRGWTTDDMDKITELHTLINAVHQTSIRQLMYKFKYADSENRVVFKENYDEYFSFFDCSENKMSKRMEDFISSLRLGKLLKEGINVVVKDNKLICSKSLGAHSVDIFVDLDEGIRVSFNDSGRGDGNAMRVLLLASLFSQAGFDITNFDATVSKTDGGVCNFTAMFSLPKGALNNGIEYAKYFEQALKILERTTDLDYDIEGNDVDTEHHLYNRFKIPSYSIEDFKKMKYSTDMPRGFETLMNLKRERERRSEGLSALKEQIEQRDKAFDPIYDYLSIDVSKKNKWEIVSEYVKGKLKIEKGVLKINESYNGIAALLEGIDNDVDDSLKQAQVINLLDNDNFNFEVEGYIGGMVALSGTLRLDDKGWLSIKTAVDKERKRAKFAYVEFVDFNGKRTPLTCKELINKLKEFGYTVKEQKPRSKSEKNSALTVLRERILFPKDGIYTRGMGVSGQEDKYIPVRVTYDKNNVDQNSMWIVSQTTPDDVETIIKTGAIMTTTGGMLSHANITARENNKVAILSNGQWVNGKLEVPYYSVESPIEKSGKYEVQKISEHRLVLKEGDVVLANGINGRVLVYNDIPSQTISEIQSAINDNNVKFILDYIQDHFDDKNIRQVIEYIFLQVIADKEKNKITEILLPWRDDPTIGKKISELLKVYTGEKIKALKIYIENERAIKDANVRFGIINFIEQELRTLESSLAGSNYNVAEENRKLVDIVKKDKNEVISQIKENVKNIIMEINVKFEKLSNLDISEKGERDELIDELVKISERAKVWGFYGSSKIKELVNEIDKIIVPEKGENYETEIKGFEDIRARDVLKYGTKTTQTAQVYRLLHEENIDDADVPYGTGISRDVLRIFFEHNGLGEQYSKLIEDFEQTIKSQNKERAIEIGKQISKLIEATDDKELENLLKSKLDDNKKYAVRSSGGGEDGPNHSFAGMAKTMLNVHKDNVYASVKECWQAFFTETCIENMIKTGVAIQPALLVQEMVVDVEKAGVIFTKDNSGNSIIEGVLGLGDGLVSGRITPDHITIRAYGQTIVYRRALNKMIKIEEKEDGGTRVAKITAEEKIERILDEDIIRRLKKISNILEEDSGYPVDIEFAIDKNRKISVLQRRAITTLVSQESITLSPQDSNAVPVIEQSLIDRTINFLSPWTSNIQEIQNVINKLSDLPKDETERYNTIVEEVYNLIDILKKKHRLVIRPGGSSSYNVSKPVSEEDEFGKFCIDNKIVTWNDRVDFDDFLSCLLIPFLNIEDTKNSGEPLFNSIVDYWLNEEESRGGVAVGEMATLMRVSYSINPNIIPYTIDSLIKYKHISSKGNVDRDIYSELIKDYDALKQYYFAISSREKKDEELSNNLKNIVDDLKGNLINLIRNKERQENVGLILSRIEELSNRINSKNIGLLQVSVNDLWKIISKEDKNNMENAVVCILPLFVCLAKGGNQIEENQMKTIFDILKSSYNANFDNKRFNYMLDVLIDISKQLYDLNNENSRKICNKIIETILLVVYAPVSTGSLDKNSSEYKDRESTFYAIFNKLISEFPNNLGLFSYLFASTTIRNPEVKAKFSFSWDDDDDEYDENAYIYGPGLNSKTARMYINTIHKSNRKDIVIPVPKRDSDIGDINELADLFVKNRSFFNLSISCRDLFKKEENGNAQKLAVAIIKKLFEEIEKKDVEYEEKQEILSTFISMATSDLYMSAQKYNFFDIDKLNDLCRKYNLPYYLKSVTDSYAKFDKGESTRGEYKLVNLLKQLPKSIFGYISGVVQEPPILYTFDGETKNNDKQVELTRNKFNTLQQVLNDNTLALSLLNGLSKAKTLEKNVEELIGVLSGMIKGLSLINEEHGFAAQTALDNIVKNLYNREDNKIATLDSKKVRRQTEIKQWDENRLSEITEIHTLINAVHQTIISDLKSTIEDTTGNKSIKTITATHQNLRYDSDYLEQTGIKIYDLSEKELNSDIIDFIGRLSQMQLPYPRAVESKPDCQINDFVCMDNFLVWTTRLFVHSVDVFMNFAESDKTITIAYHEGGRSFGNSERVKYFSAVLENLGFSVEADTKEGGEGVCSLKATLSSNYGLSEDMDFVDIATKVISLFKYSDMLDFDLFDYGDDEGEYSSGSGYKNIFDDFVKKFMNGDIWYGYRPTDKKGWGSDLLSLPKRKSLVNKREELIGILRYLGLSENIPQDINQNNLDKYFNAIIERAFAVGRIKLDKDGTLKKNEDYNILSYLANGIYLNEEESINESRLINLIPRNKFKFKSVGYMGDLVAVSGYLKLENGNYLSVKGLVNPVTRRMKYAITEEVTYSGREPLKSDDLIKILGKEGYVIPQQEWIGSREKIRIKNMLLRQVQTIESPKIPSTPTSDGTGVSVVGNITFDKNNIDENSIFIVPYTTPDDIELIQKAKGIITTGGGVLSHAAITTRELKKPSVVLNGATWINKEIEVLYYLASGEPETINNQFQVQKIEETSKLLKEGARVLINGETGTVLLFDDIDVALLDKLQSYIDTDNARAVIDFMNNHLQDENINRFVEYIYFQVIGNVKTTQVLDSLFSDNMPEIVKDKIKKLNDGYIQDKIQNISEAVENLKTIENVNIAHNILQEVIKKLNFIKTVGVIQDLENLKEQIGILEVDIKNRLNIFLQQFIDELNALLLKDKLSNTDVQKILTMLKNVEIYDYFVSANEKLKDLLDKKETLRDLVSKMKDKINEDIKQKEETNLQEEISLFEENASDEKLFGSKTSQLAKMFKLLKGIKGVIVPGGIGISVNVMPKLFKTLGKENLLTEFENAIKKKDKQKAMELAGEICNLIDSKETIEVEDAANTVKMKKVTVQSVSPERIELEKEIIEQLNKFITSDGKYSVRSSGVGEDATNNAFAGMGKTILNADYDDIYNSVKECWKSFFAERCIDYMISSGQIVKPAVLVEEMVDSEISGVIFSRDKYGKGRINALFGQGEGLVSGMFTPDSVLFDMSTGEIIEYSVADKQFKLVTDAEGGLKKVSVGEMAKTRALSAQNVKKLAEIISILENSVGYPIDVEFAIKGDEIYILQMRPITTLETEKKEEITEEQIREVLRMEGLLPVEQRYEISVTVGQIPKGQDAFAYIANPLEPTQAVPIYKKSVNGKLTEFVVDAKFSDIVKDGSLGKLLLNRINTDPVILAKLNNGIFNFKTGEIALLPVSTDDIVIDETLPNTPVVDFENIRSLLASA